MVVSAIACLAVAAALAPLCLRHLMQHGGWKAAGSVCIAMAVLLACAGPMMLMHAFSTVVVFTDLHRSVPWTPEWLREPTKWNRWFAGPPYLTQVPFMEDDDDDDAQST